jgi:DmsE family decaheme c-type cytochrome
VPIKSPVRLCSIGLVVTGLLMLGMASCQSPHQPERRAETNLDPGSPRGNPLFTQVSYQAVKAALPTVPGAEFVNDDDICLTCHETYVKTFANNVHRGDGCESCHGPASRHVEKRGKEPGLIFSFKKNNPVVLAEACLKCHEENQCTAGTRWRTSRHAHCGVTCVSCHRAHYNVPPGTPAASEAKVGQIGPEGRSVIATDFLDNGNSVSQPSKKSKLPSLRGTSHNLGAVAPHTCYRCHNDMKEFQEVAGPHQICGPNGFNCTTCHDPHGQILETSRKDLCLECHDRAPTMAWHSSSHNRNGVACTDCHNPHPRTQVPLVANISHRQVERPKRQQMCVDEPRACYKCHQKIYGLNALPSHHPIKEGKMVCSDCHDPHGQETANLKEATVNLLCYKCHAEKQGPFAIEHAPVRENCDICHNPHGTVTNNLLKQPTTFLCLRCHAGHHARHGPGFAAMQGLRVDNDPTLRPQYYTNCTQCHTQTHGTDRVDQRGGTFFTR